LVQNIIIYSQIQNTGNLGGSHHSQVRIIALLASRLNSHKLDMHNLFLWLLMVVFLHLWLTPPKSVRCQNEVVWATTSLVPRPDPPGSGLGTRLGYNLTSSVIPSLATRSPPGRCSMKQQMLAQKGLGMRLLDQLVL